MGRFLMNVMLASGGYPWTIVPVEGLDEYMAALESASVGQDTKPFAARSPLAGGYGGREPGPDGGARVVWVMVPAGDPTRDTIRDLAHLLYSVCDRKRWSESGQRFNNLASSWSDLLTEARNAERRGPRKPKAQPLF